jgi:hypothetical protein
LQGAKLEPKLALAKLAEFMDDPDFTCSPDDEKRLLALISSMPLSVVVDAVKLGDPKWRWVREGWHRKWAAAALSAKRR